MSLEYSPAHVIAAEHYTRNYPPCPVCRTTLKAHNPAVSITGHDAEKTVFIITCITCSTDLQLVIDTTAPPAIDVYTKKLS